MKINAMSIAGAGCCLLLTGVAFLAGCGGGTRAAPECGAVPSLPTGLSASATTLFSTNLSWKATGSPANCGSVSYVVYRNGISIGTTNSTTFTVTGLLSATTYRFKVAANDTVGSSGQSAPLDVTTLGSPPSPGSIAESFFGLHFHYAADVPSVIYGTCRIWGVPGAFWPQIETRAGVFDFTALDGILADAKLAGINDGCVFTFGPTPAWISPNPTDPNCDTLPGSCWPPTDLNFDGTGTDQSVINAITAIATHVNDPTYLQTHAHIRYWEPWNEPYRSSVLSGTVCSPAHLCTFNGSYAQLVRIAQDLRTVVRGIDPTALIITPSGNAYFQFNGQLVVANFLNCANSPLAGSGCTTGNSGSNAVDVINTHCYVWSQNPDDVIGYIQAMRALLSPTDLAKPFLCDEGGWGTDSTTSDPDLQAGFLARWFVDIASQNVAFAGWYAWDDAAWGTLWNSNGQSGCTQTGGCLTSAGVAYEQVNSWLAGAALGSCTVSGAATSCPLTRGGGYQAEMVWVNTTLTNCAGQSSAETCGSTPYSVPSQFITKCDLAGVCKAPQAVEMIGAKPLLFQNQ